MTTAGANSRRKTRLGRIERDPQWNGAPVIAAESILICIREQSP